MIWHDVIATSFADPDDVAAFLRCKDAGGTDKQCFRVGDNGVGCWGDDTTINIPMCALPPDDWMRFGAAARGKLVEIERGTERVVCELRDRMPWKRNIKNGSGIDLNKAACAALGLQPPIKTKVRWRWIEE